MTRSLASAVAESPRVLTIPGVEKAVVMTLTLAFCTGLALYRLGPPAVTEVGGPPAKFAAGRALDHLRAISIRPHPVGSPDHARVREYLFRQLQLLGLKTEVQQDSTFANILARLRGTGDGGAILLVAHYDSVPTSPGAGDNGMAVASLLETVRALKAATPLRNDVILLFTDGEEVALKGAQSFAYLHPWRKDVKVVFNFDARGNSGPVLMFETSTNNGWLVSQYAAAVRNPVANSLMYEIYRWLPNDTDFTVFKRNGMPGLNFACIGGFYTYHGPLDSLENLSVGSLQHMGAQALALARHFGAQDLNQSSTPDAIYFDVLGARLVTYSSNWAWPITLLCAALYGATFTYGLRRRRLRPSHTALGFLALLGCMAIVAVVMVNATALIEARTGDVVKALQPDNPAGRPYALSLLSFTAAIVTASFAWLRLRFSVENLLMGAMLWWLILLLLATSWIPGGSYLFAWPLLFTLLAALHLLATKDGTPVSVKYFVTLLLCSVPGIVLLAPMAYLILIGLTMKMAALVMLLPVLLSGLLIPHIDLATAKYRWLLPCAATATGLVLFLTA